MEINITERRENAVLDRVEVLFEATHPNEGTPTRAELRKILAARLNAKDGVVILDWARSEFGKTTTRGYAKWYHSKERAMALETAPILIRNGLKEAPKKKAPAAEEAPKEAKPAKEKEAPKEAKAPPPKEAPKEKPKEKEAPKPEAKKEAKPEAKPAREKEAPKGKEPAKEPAKKEAPKEKKPAKEGK